MGGKELLEDPWSQRCLFVRCSRLMEHVEHVVEHVEVGVLSEMICWPFSWVPGLGKKNSQKFHILCSTDFDHLV